MKTTPILVIIILILIGIIAWKWLLPSHADLARQEAEQYQKASRQQSEECHRRMEEAVRNLNKTR